MYYATYSVGTDVLRQAGFDFVDGASVEGLVDALVSAISRPNHGASIRLVGSWARPSVGIRVVWPRSGVDVPGTLRGATGLGLGLRPIESRAAFDAGDPPQGWRAMRPQRSFYRSGGYLQYLPDFSGGILAELAQRAGTDANWGYQLDIAYRASLLDEERWLRRLLLDLDDQPVGAEERDRVRADLMRRISCRFYADEVVWIAPRDTEMMIGYWSEFRPRAPLQAVPDPDASRAGLHPLYTEPELASEHLCAGVADVDELNSVISAGYSARLPRAPAGGHWDVFLAHASSDKPIVRRYYSEFVRRGARAGRGLRVFIDEAGLDPGVRWTEAIPDALRRSRLVVVFLSLASGRAWYANDEIQLAIELRRTGSLEIVPVLLDEPSRIDMPYGLRTLQAIHDPERRVNSVVEAILDKLR